MLVFLQTIIPLLLVLLGGVGWMYKHEKEKRLLVEKQLSERKHEVYYKIMSLFFDLLKMVKNGQKIEGEQFIETLINIKRDLVAFSNDKVIYAYLKWEKLSTKNAGLQPFAELMLEIRKDMGHPDTMLKVIDVLKMVTSDEEVLNEVIRTENANNKV